MTVMEPSKAIPDTMPTARARSAFAMYCTQEDNQHKQLSNGNETHRIVWTLSNVAASGTGWGRYSICFGGIVGGEWLRRVWRAGCA